MIKVRQVELFLKNVKRIKSKVFFCKKYFLFPKTEENYFQRLKIFLFLFSEIKKLSAEIHLNSGEVQMLMQRSNPDAQPPNQDLNVRTKKSFLSIVVFVITSFK